MLSFFLLISSSTIVFGINEEKLLNTEIENINGQIQSQKDKLKRVRDEQAKYTEIIKQKQGDKANLENQLSILDNRLEKAKLDIEAVEIEIDEVELEINKTEIEIDVKNTEIETEKEHIKNIIQVIYKKDQADTLEIILLNNSLVDFLNQMRYLEDINEEMGESLDNLERLKNQLEKSKELLDKKNIELESLKKKLENDKLALENEKKSKELLLEQVKESEKEYQNLLAKARQEQSQAAIDIASLEKEMRDKIEKLSEKQLDFNDDGLIWPVPKNVITAKFHDPDYPFKYIFEHPAIDIRAGQGTTLKAAASGYVARVKLDNTSSYGYIMLVHGDGLSTVYGHVSKAYIKEDQYVSQGQTIGLSGGMPGTPGAGNLTTGPHLHFEVRLNGIPVNPEEYLP